MFDNNDFKGYRNLLGFNSQNAFKEFLGAKDIQPCVDFNYLNALKKRLIEIFSAINSVYCFKYNEYEESIESFKRNPKADFLLNNHLLLEVQSGFQGINDIKEHKVIEAKRRLITDKIPTIVVHFDLFNGQVACVEISKIKDNDLNWITRQQMEGQSVFNISQNFFDYKITEIPNKPLS
ncbi:restriction endonuclease [Helicobacter pylori]|uniref:restriction endonuclease n=1 Tax=Helicobacter pylori TaxID=210 RepID=UPI001AA79253|nr:restriction endonuclease [Helicobacter pylori]GHP25981.1 hypothetical protein JP0038_04450 [Helicobacter pylori]GHP38077.1 hypothetical protein JP0040_15020 [Helicobacter pylori]GHP69714.1 hypothetical protein JP0047_14500 [Helicobacter pylori]GHQ64903.1 hypothetical protein JP0074_13790 [Helicobacter pylori]